MKFIINDKEVLLENTDISNIVNLYKLAYSSECNEETITQLSNIKDDSCIKVDVKARIVYIDDKPLTYSHTFILGKFIREHREKLGCALQTRYTENALVSVSMEQLKSINKQCVVMLAEIKAIPKKFSSKVKLKYVDMFNNICIAVNRLRQLAGSYSVCDEKNFKAFCDCSDLMIDLREQIGIRMYRVKIKKEVS